MEPVFQKIRLNKINDFGKMCPKGNVVYFLVYELEPTAEFETELIRQIHPEPFEELVKIQLKETANLYQLYGRPPEFPSLGVWWQSFLGQVYVRDGYFEEITIKKFVGRAREWRNERIKIKGRV